MRLLSVVALASVILLSVGCSKDQAEQASKAASQGEPALAAVKDPGGMAVKVNGKVLTNQEVAEEEGRLLQQMGGRVDPAQMEQMRGVLREQAVSNIVDRELLKQAIDKEGITIDQAELDSRIAEMKERLGSDEALAQQLAMAGMSEELLLKEMGTAMKVEKLLEKQGTAQPVTPADAQQYYDENPGRFKQPERVKASHILIQVNQDDTEATKYEKKREAERLLAEIQQGADFGQLAAAHSSCPSKEQGGDLGYFQRGQMVKPFEDAAFSLNSGQVSGIVETQFGYHIIKVTGREDAKTVSFDEAKEGLTAFLDRQRKQEAMQTYVEGLRTAAKIEYPE